MEHKFEKVNKEVKNLDPHKNANSEEYQNRKKKNDHDLKNWDESNSDGSFTIDNR